MTLVARRPLLYAAIMVLLLLAAPASAQPEVGITHSPQAPVQGQPVRFEAAFDGNATGYRWDFGDNTTSEASTPLKTYTATGTFQVRVTIQTPDGDLSGQKAVVVTAPPADRLQPAWGFPSWLYYTSPLVVGLVLLGIALMVLVRGQPVIYNRVFFMLYAASAVKSFTEFLFYLTAFEFSVKADLIYPILAFNRAIGFLYPHFFLWFVLVFPRPLRPWLKNGWRGSVVLLLAVPFFLLEYALGGVDTRTLFNGYVSVLALVALGLLVYHAWETDSAEERHRIRLLALTFFLLVFSTIVVFLMQFMAATSHGAAAAGYEQLALASGLIFVPLLEIVGCVLLMYAILRYQLLGVELFLRRVTRATTFAIGVGSVFVIVSNSVEQLFESKWLGQIRFGFIVAGFISTIMLYPIQKATERIANRLFPDAASASPDHLSTRRMEIYEAQLRYALLDGTLKQKELTMLHALRDSLQLRPEELRRVAQRFPNLNPTLLLPRPLPRPR